MSGVKIGRRRGHTDLRLVKTMTVEDLNKVVKTGIGRDRAKCINELNRRVKRNSRVTEA